ncbi:hypothetical protein GGI43DRAFT_412451 [Trichoderma evansii]
MKYLAPLVCIATFASAVSADDVTLIIIAPYLHKNTTVSTTSDGRIFDVRKAATDNFGIHSEYLELFFHDEVLHDDKIISYYNLKDGDILIALTSD